MTQNDLVSFWEDGAKEAWKTVQALLVSKRNLHALFFCHLTLEKILKAKYAKVLDAPPPPTHHLVSLGKQIHLELSDEQWGQLTQIMQFNISARYEDVKDTLFKKATAEYMKEWVGATESLFILIQLL